MKWLLSFIVVPVSHVAGMCMQVSARFKKLIIKGEVEVVGLQVGDDKDRRHHARKLTEGIVNVLRL